MILLSNMCVLLLVAIFLGGIAIMIIKLVANVFYVRTTITSIITILLLGATLPRIYLWLF